MSEKYCKSNASRIGRCENPKNINNSRKITILHEFATIKWLEDQVEHYEEQKTINIEQL
jgi:hypothetical protein